MHTTLNVPDDRIYSLSEVTFHYDFRDTVRAPLIDLSKSNVPRYMQADGTMYSLEHYMQELEAALSGPWPGTANTHKKKGAARMGDENRKIRHSNRAMLVLNAAIIGLILAAFVHYSDASRTRLWQQNVTDAANLNRAAATLTESLFESRETVLLSFARYIDTRGFSLQETLDYLCEANADTSATLQLVGTDGKGWLIQQDAMGQLATVDYTARTYSTLQTYLASASAQSAGAAALLPEFTDSDSAFPCFALSTAVPVVAEDGMTEWYTLMALQQSAAFLKSLQTGNYADFSTVITNAEGNYILHSSAFKSDNFFQYLYVFNDLTLDARHAIEAEVAEKGDGWLLYKDSRGRSCVFTYTRMPDSGQYAVSCVPESSFPTGSTDFSFSLMVGVLLALLLATDVIWLNRMNERLRRSIAHEHEANRAKTDFLSRMSHDIRTPLNGIIGMTLLSLEEADPTVLRANLRNIQTSSTFLLGLINDVLDMSKVESGKMELHPEPYTLRELQSYIEAVIRPLCDSHGLTLEITGFDDETPFEFDRLRLNQILFNLLSNSVKFTPEGGQVTLRCRLSEGTDASLRTLDLSVSDTGIGMSKEFQKHMFEAFSQEASPDGRGQKGTGLGLAIVQNLVQLMHGQMRVDSEPGRGTTFSIRLETAVSAAPTAALRHAGEAGEASLEGRRVLLCEDHDLNAQIAIRLLQKRGVTCERAENGQVGIDKFSAAAPGYYDAILMDVRMPVLDGLEATRRIRMLPRADAGHIPILAMTANAYDTDIQNCLEAGMNAHLAKPIDPALLYTKLAQAIAEHELRKS